MGKRADVILILKGLIFVLEFKTNEILFKRSDLDECLDYALDLKVPSIKKVKNSRLFQFLLHPVHRDLENSFRRHMKTVYSFL